MNSDDKAALAFGAGLLLGGIAATVWATSLSEGEAQRQTFHARLRNLLAGRNCELISATFGRTTGNEGRWSVTYESPRYGPQLLFHTIPAGQNPYAAMIADQITERVL